MSIFFRKALTVQNIIFSISLIIVILIAFGMIGRIFAFGILLIYLGYFLRAPVSKGIELFLRSIPIFIALPITENFDNFNMWRVLILFLFLRWFFESGMVNDFLTARWRLYNLKMLFSRYGIECFGIAFFCFAAVSLLVAPNLILGLKRLIFFVNATFLFIIIASLLRKNRHYVYEFAKNVAYSGVLAGFFGYMQFFAAYFTPAWVFHYWWGQVVSLGLYGHQWANIVTNFGNTWFSYSGETLRLRMFGMFPDSHSFPMYLIMTVPAMVYVLVLKHGSLRAWIIEARKLHIYHLLRERRGTFIFGGFALLNLALILTGTRGIWVGGFLALTALLLLRLVKVAKPLRTTVAIWFLIFVCMFPVYFAIISFPQFQDTDFTTSAAALRLRSIIDLSELSKQGRVHIWKETLTYVARSPIFGIGIGNFPYILSEPLSASRAGASAHNLYLDIASTIGIFGLTAFFGFIFEFVRRSIRFLKQNPKTLEAVYVAVMLFALAWIGAYLMTDAALYDERALLAFMAMTGMSVGIVRGRVVE